MELAAQYALDDLCNGQSSSDMLYSWARLAEHSVLMDHFKPLVKNCSEGRVMEAPGCWLLELIERGGNMNSFD